MCGIFALLCSDNESLDHKLINEYFLKGSKRGPEHSVLQNIKSDIIFGFHRLAINGLDVESNQPIISHGNYLICNGEIYNHSELFEQQKLDKNTNSDCEAILKGYERNGINIINMLDGVFGCLIYDNDKGEIIAARDPYGVRPLYICYYENNNIGFASDLAPLMFDKNIKYINQFEPGTHATFKKIDGKFTKVYHERYFYNTSYVRDIVDKNKPLEYYMYALVKNIQTAVMKRVNNCEREIASLLSGGLDSSIISAYVCRFYKEKTGIQLETYSIGLENGTDLEYARMVANHINSNHTEITCHNEDFISSIPDVIKDVESYDTTTVRASTGNWNVAKYIKENSDAKVIFNGDGADELMGGYMYFHKAPNDEEFHNECLRLLSKISYFDVQRSDKSISSHGLEPRTPFLDKEFTKFYLSIPIEYRNHNNDKNCEKYLIRKAIELYDPTLLPKEVLWRKKEAFSDGVSSLKKSWFEIIRDHLLSNNIKRTSTYAYNVPQTSEQHYFRDLFVKEFPSCDTILPYFWMPKYVNATDSSARTLDVYKKIES